MERFRNKVLEYPTTLNGSYHRRFVSCSSGADWQEDDINVSALSSEEFQDSWDFNDHPDFAKRISAGEIISSPCRITTKRIVRPGLVDFDLAWRSSCAINVPKTAGYSLDGQVCPSCSYGATYVKTILEEGLPAGYLAARDRAIEIATVGAHAKVDVAEMQALATLAEGRESVQSMCDILKRVIKIARAAKRLDVKALRREISPKELANRYMELRYAVRPMIMDANGILNAIEKTRTHVRKTFTATQVETYEEYNYVDDAGVRQYLAVDLKRSFNAVISARAGVIADCEVDAISTYGTDQLAETLVEIIPFSFIAEWFCNVGDVVAAWTPNAGIKERASWVSIKTTIDSLNATTGSGRNTMVGNYTSLSGSVSSFIYGIQLKELERVLNPDLTVFPSFIMNLDQWKLLDLGIILRNIFRSPTPRTRR